MFKQLQRTPCLVALTLLFSLMMAPAQASDLPDYYPKSFQWVGTLSKLDLRENTITVRDALFTLAQKVKVYTPRSRFGTLHSLRPGMNVGCKIEADAQGQKVISAIWVMPQSNNQMLLSPPPMR